MKTFYVFVLISLSGITNISYSQNYWREDTSGVNVRLNAVVCFSSTIAWCCGNNGTVLRIRPMFFGPAQRWTNVSGNGIPAGIDLVTIASPTHDTNIALTTGTMGGITYVYRTSNAGTNWTQVFSQANGKINAMWFAEHTNTNVFLQGNPVGGRWTIFRSTNGGINWDSSGLYLPQNGSETGWSNSVFSYYTDVWFGTNNSRIYYSTNSGVSWTVQSTAPEINSYTIMTNVGFQNVFSGGSSLMKSTNSGTNWSQIASMGTGNFGGMGTWGSYWWYVRSDNKIYISSNNGAAWNTQYTSPAGDFTNMCSAPNSIFMIAVRSNGGISRYLILVGVQQLSGQVPEKFSLSQNYPNPFNPSTKIKFDVPKTSFTKLVVYDLLGREVTTLVNEELTPGTYSADWDASNFSSGVYFYKIIAGNYTETRKMVLMK